MKIGEKIYSLIGTYGNPWGGSSTAIIAGLGMRLINESFRLSNINISLESEIKQCFTCCDDDHELLKKSLDGESVNINESTLKLVDNIVTFLEKTKEYKDKINNKAYSDYLLGVFYCISAANGCMELMKANAYVGVLTEDLLEGNRKLILLNELLSGFNSMKLAGLKQNTIVGNSTFEGGNTLTHNKQTPAKPDDRSDNVEKIQDMIEHTIENMEQAEDTLRNPEIDMSEHERQQIEEKNDRRREALDGFRSEVKDEASYNQKND